MNGPGLADRGVFKSTDSAGKLDGWAESFSLIPKLDKVETAESIESKEIIVDADGDSGAVAGESMAELMFPNELILLVL